MTSRPHRVLVVDDSAFARKVLRELLSTDSRLEVVGFARDGLDALEKIAALTPDVITLDLVMPELDGVGVLEALRDRPSPPRAVVVSMTDTDSPLGVAALEAGAFEVVHKPTSLATDRLYEMGAELVAKVILAAESTTPHGVRPSVRPAVERPVPADVTKRLVVIGASTGGPRAITTLLGSLPASLPVPIAVVIHMPVGYTEAFARRLDTECALSVTESVDGGVLAPGTVTIARAGMHLGVRRDGGQLRTTLGIRPIDAIHRPAVDVLFRTAAAEIGRDVLGVVLTGMGTDGLEGAQAIHAAGGKLLVEAASTAVVYGMPRAVAEAGLDATSVAIDRMAQAIIASL